MAVVKGGRHPKRVRVPPPFPATMHTPSLSDPMSIFMGGKLKPGKYKVQNLASKTYLEVLEHSKELCCRPETVLSPEDALLIYNTHSNDHRPDTSQWGFEASGSGYKIKKVRDYR